MHGAKSVKLRKKFAILNATPEDDKEYACINTCYFLPQKRLRVFADVMQLLQIIHLEAWCDSFYINCKNVLSCLSFLLNCILISDITEGVTVEKHRIWGSHYVRI
jgi:hypothetical protein